MGEVKVEVADGSRWKGEAELPGLPMLHAQWLADWHVLFIHVDQRGRSSGCMIASAARQLRSEMRVWLRSGSGLDWVQQHLHDDQDDDEQPQHLLLAQGRVLLAGCLPRRPPCLPAAMHGHQPVAAQRHGSGCASAGCAGGIAPAGASAGPARAHNKQTGAAGDSQQPGTGQRNRESLSNAVLATSLHGADCLGARQVGVTLRSGRSGGHQHTMWHSMRGDQEPCKPNSPRCISGAYSQDGLQALHHDLQTAPDLLGHLHRCQINQSINYI